MTAPAPQLADVSIPTFNTQDAELNLLQVFQQVGQPHTHRGCRRPRGTG